jgi:hypothetical protein
MEQKAWIDVKSPCFSIWTVVLYVGVMDSGAKPVSFALKTHQLDGKIQLKTHLPKSCWARFGHKTQKSRFLMKPAFS